MFLGFFSSLARSKYSSIFGLLSLFDFVFFKWAQSAGTVKYPDCTSAEGKKTSPTNVLHIILMNLMARRFGECGVSLHCNCSQVLSSPEW